MCFGRKKEIIKEKIKDRIIKLQLNSGEDVVLLELANNLINSHPLIIDFSKLGRDFANKAIAFLSGVSFTLGGTVENVKDEVYLFTFKDAYADGTLNSFLKEVR